MISISTHVQSWLDENPTVRAQVAEGIINYSALARKIQPAIEDVTGEKASLESITIALNRLGKTLQSTYQQHALHFIGDVSVQTGLTILIYNINEFDSLELPDATTRQKGYFVLTRGIWHASIITTTHIASDTHLTKFCTEAQDNITSITIKLHEGHIPVPGVCAGILAVLANKGVNLQEVISTHNELTILTDQINTERALHCLLRAKQSRAQLGNSY